MGFCELANERNGMRYFQSNIMPTLQGLNICAADFARASMPVLTIHGTKGSQRGLRRRIGLGEVVA
jgi:hypothetical protein